MDGPFRTSPQLEEANRFLVEAHRSLGSASALLRGVVPFSPAPSTDNVKIFELASGALFEANDALARTGTLLEEVIVSAPVLRAARSRDDGRGRMQGGWSDWLTSLVVRRRIAATLRTVEGLLDRTSPGGHTAALSGDS